jgi:hypothetical protein
VGTSVNVSAGTAAGGAGGDVGIVGQRGEPRWQLRGETLAGVADQATIRLTRRNADHDQRDPALAQIAHGPAESDARVVAGRPARRQHHDPGLAPSGRGGHQAAQFGRAGRLDATDLGVDSAVHEAGTSRLRRWALPCDHRLAHRLVAAQDLDALGIGNGDARVARRSHREHRGADAQRLGRRHGGQAVAGEDEVGGGRRRIDPREQGGAKPGRGLGIGGRRIAVDDDDEALPGRRGLDSGRRHRREHEPRAAHAVSLRRTPGRTESRTRGRST